MFLYIVSQDDQIRKMIDDELIRRCIRKSGSIILDKDTIKLLKALYNETTPKLIEIIKTKGVKGEQVPAAVSRIRLARRVRSTQCQSEGKR